MQSRAPLVVRWHALELASVQAGAAQQAAVELENAGSASWRTRGHEEGLSLSYHWLDERGNPIVWDGRRTPLTAAVEPGATLEQTVEVCAPIPPGPYRFAVDLVEEHRFWVAELGTEPWEKALEVQPREASAARVFGAEPDAAWRTAAAKLHAEGYTAVGGAVDGLKEYAAGGGRHPRFPQPLVCPSLLPPHEPNCDVDGLPAGRREEPDEPYMYDGRLVLRTLRR